MSFKPHQFKNVGGIILSVAEILKPAEDMTVSQAAERYRYVNQPGAYVGPWLNKTTPMMVQPMDLFTSRLYNGIVFVGPAQSGKTDSLILNTVAYTIKVEPMDTMIVCPTMTAGRDFSMRRIDRLHRHSKDIGSMMLKGADFDNKFDKQYINGMLLTISWPTPTELAGKPIGRIVMTDFDRMPMDVGPGDGNPYDLASKRTTTYGSYAMCLAESSPSKEIIDLKWVARTQHEAPPCEGILALYNRGDRRRWYWPCLGCGHYFEGNFKHLTYEKRSGQTNLEIADSVRLKCPYCSHEHEIDDRDEMNARGLWLMDGQGVGKDGIVFGPVPRTSIASFWLNGIAATFTNWKKLLTQYLDAEDEYERTKTQDALRKFYNNDLGEPYREKGLDELRLPETLKARAEPLRERHVPQGVRFMVATVDVQQNMWVVTVFGILPGAPFDSVLIDRFNVQYSKRLNDVGERHWVKPATYQEDWDELTEHVIEKEYPLDDDSGRMMSIKMVACDSGGKAGVTARAYDYYRKLRSENKHRRFILVKGEGTPGNPRCRITTPDSNQRDKNAIARGDVPVLIFNSNLLKDDLNGRLDCMEPGKGMYRTPNWLSDKFYAELCTEIRGAKGWENPAQHRNESWDLSYYMIGLCVSELVRVEGISWSNPPSWASDWSGDGMNDFVRKVEEPAPFANTIKSSHNFSDYAKALA
jgi:phage terminase large subunit GpA-like protein